MLGGDERRIRLVYSLMFSLPGTPTLFYGEEIGMGENLDVEGRLAVRTPMQWDDGPNGGFSTAPKRRLTRPQPTGLFGPEQVNAAAQRQDPDSLWSFVRLLIRRYRQMPQIGWSDLEVLDHDVPAVLAHVCRRDEWSMLAVHNLGTDDAIVALDLGPVAEGSVLRDVLGSRPDQPVEAERARRGARRRQQRRVAEGARAGRAGLRLTRDGEELGERPGDGPGSLAGVRDDGPGEVGGAVVDAAERHPGIRPDEGDHPVLRAEPEPQPVAVRPGTRCCGPSPCRPRPRRAGGRRTHRARQKAATSPVVVYRPPSPVPTTGRCRRLVRGRSCQR